MEAQSGFDAYIANWLRGLDSEIAYWNTVFLAGYPSPAYLHADARASLGFNHPELLPLACPEGGTLRVLDVGSGPVSCLGFTAPAPYTIELSACDPLAPVYNAIIDRHGYAPPVRTSFALGEHLASFHEPGSFHIVHMSNALDHAFDPLAVLDSMLRVCRTGGVVSLHHNENEALFQDYEGLHHWNISAEDGELFFWSRDQRLNITRLLQGAAEVSCTRTPLPGGRVMVSAVIRKLAEAQLPVRGFAAGYESVFKLLCCLMSADCRGLAAGSPAFADVLKASRPRHLRTAWKRFGRGVKRLLLRLSRPGAKP